MLVGKLLAGIAELPETFGQKIADSGWPSR
jgi:hypothetical protein